MIRCDTFVRSVAFAAAAALLWLPWAVFAYPLLGLGNARALYLVAVAALYLGGIAPPRTRRAAVALPAALAGVAIACVARGPSELAIGLAAVIGIGRGVFLYRAAAPRAALAEAVLLLGGLLFARYLSGPTPGATGLAVWGFFLVQSFYFLLGGVRARAAAGRAGDPFEDAYRRALRVLERGV